MATVLKASKRMIILENVTHIQVLPDAALLFPAGFYTIRMTGEEAMKAVEQARAAGFVGNEDLLINSRRLVLAEEDVATARLMLDGFQKTIIVPAAFLSHLEPTPAPVTVSIAGKPKRKSAGGTGSAE